MTIDSDIRITPDWLLDIVREFGRGCIALDVCTQPENPAKADEFYCLEQGTDGLIENWGVDAGGGLCWGNVPFSRGQVIVWANKAVREAQFGAEILVLTKDDCRTKWNRLLVSNSDARCRVERGVGFLEPDGAGGYRKLPGSPWGSCIWYFGRQRRRFERFFSPLGEVIHGLGPVEVPCAV